MQQLFLHVVAIATAIACCKAKQIINFDIRAIVLFMIVFFQPILPPPTAAITTAQGRIRTDGPQQPGFLGKSSKIAEENNSVEELGQVIFLAASPLSATDRKERSRRAATGAEKATKLYTRRRRPSWLCWSMNLAAAAGRNGVWKLGNESRMVAACSRRARDRRHDRDSRQKKTQGRPMLYHSST